MQMQITTSLMMKYLICILSWPNIKENIRSKQNSYFIKISNKKLIFLFNNKKKKKNTNKLKNIYILFTIITIFPIDRISENEVNQ